jgi:putative peptidoglycan lipid II flippase
MTANANGRRPSMTRTALLLLPVQVVFRTGEALLPLLLALWFGRSRETDLYYLASAFFTFAGALISAAFQDSALIPVLTEVGLQDAKSLPKVAGSLLAHALSYGALLALVMGGVALAGFRLRYGADLFPVALRLTAPFAVYLVAVGCRSFFVGVLNTHEKYFAHPVASGFGITIAIGIIALGRSALGVGVLPVALLCGEAVAIALLAWMVRSLVGLRLVLTLERPEPVRRFFRLAFSEVSGNALTRVNPVVDQLFAGLTGVLGGGTVLRYAMDVASLPTSIIQATVLPVLLSRMSQLAAQGSTREFQHMVRRALVAVCGLLVVMSLALGVARGPVLRLAFLHGEMDAGGVAEMARVLPYALVGVAPFGALLVLARAHVALQNLRIMIPMGILNAGLNAVFDVILFFALGLRGIALSTSLMQLGVALAFWFLLVARLRAKGSGPATARQ